MLKQKEAGLTVKSGMGTPAGPAAEKGLWTMEDCLYHFCHRFNIYLLYPPEIISIRMDNFRAYSGDCGEKQSFLWGEYELRVCYRKEGTPGDQCRVKVLEHSFCYLYPAEERHGEERLYTRGENGIESGLTCEARYQSSSSRASFFPLLYVVNVAVEGRLTPAAAASFSESELLFDMQEEAEKRCCSCCRELPQPVEDERTVPPVQDDAAAAAGGAFAAQAAEAVIVDDPGAGEADTLEWVEDSAAGVEGGPVPAEPAAAEPGQIGEENKSSPTKNKEKVYSCPSPPSHEYYRTYRLFYEAFGLGRDCC